MEQDGRMSNRGDTGRSTAADLPALLPERAFVVEFSSGGGTAPEHHLSGRVEHVVSGQAARFASAGELLEFVQGVLRSGKPPRKKAV
jgi:hypothetical protein